MRTTPNTKILGTYLAQKARLLAWVSRYHVYLFSQVGNEFLSKYITYVRTYYFLIRTETVASTAVKDLFGERPTSRCQEAARKARLLLFLIFSSLLGVEEGKMTLHTKQGRAEKKGLDLLNVNGIKRTTSTAQNAFSLFYTHQEIYHDF